MDAMAERLESKGWETLTIPAGDAAPVAPADSYTDRHGYAYTPRRDSVIHSDVIH